MKRKTAFACGISVIAAAGAQAADLVIATVNNGHMIEMQKHTKEFEAANPGITLRWVTLEEGTLRQRVATDIATKVGQFDVMTIGLYEAPIWSKKLAGNEHLVAALKTAHAEVLQFFEENRHA